MKIYIDQRGALNMKVVYRLYLKFRHWRWRWLVGQLCLNGVVLWILFVWRRRGIIPWSPVFIQWLLLYWQLHSYQWKGTELVLSEGCYRKWEFVKVSSGTIVGIVYKVGVPAEGLVRYSLWPLSRSKWRVMNALNLIGFRILLAIRLIR